jgi:hypothetical protein
VTAEQLKAPVGEAAKSRKSDSEIARALRGKYKGADFEDLLANVREATLKGAEHDQLLKAIRHDYAQISQTRAKVIAETETTAPLLMSQYQAECQSFVRAVGPAGVSPPIRTSLRCASRSMILMNVLRNGRQRLGTLVHADTTADQREAQTDQQVTKGHDDQDDH